MARKSRQFEILHNDKELIVVNKPAGLLTVPIRGSRTISLLEVLNEHLARQRATASVVHRIDRYTSGVVLFAKNPRVRDVLVKQFLAHTPKRRYLAVVSGIIGNEEGVLEHFMRRDDDGFKQTIKERKFQGSAPARLTFKVLERLKKVTVLEVALDTGFKNQIRAQFSAIGHPLVGERQYTEAAESSSALDRQALHAWKLGFDHPGKNRWAEFEAPVPRDIITLLRREGSRLPWVQSKHT
jgi:23S rRNA pseudouridine1911/1915/1917 synthase